MCVYSTKVSNSLISKLNYNNNFKLIYKLLKWLLELNVHLRRQTSYLIDQID